MPEGAARIETIRRRRLAAGRFWRQASDDQKKRLAEAFRGTLVRTYSGALKNV
ncbi:toluene tolerance protein Ttg2D domain protein, partial [Bordetella holmesii CDC-H643-BH]